MRADSALMIDISEFYAFSYSFYNSFIVRVDLERILNIKLPLHRFKYSKQLFDLMTKGHRTTKKLLMIDIGAAT